MAIAQSIDLTGVSLVGADDTVAPARRSRPSTTATGETLGPQYREADEASGLPTPWGSGVVSTAI